MHRAQLLLEEWQFAVLRSLAERRRTSVSEIVREIVGQYLSHASEVAAADLAAIAGVGSDPSSRGRDHDRFLYGSRGRRS